MKTAVLSLALASLLVGAPASAGKISWKSWKKVVNQTSGLKDVYNGFRRKLPGVPPGFARVLKWGSGAVTAVGLAGMATDLSDGHPETFLNFFNVEASPEVSWLVKGTLLGANALTYLVSRHVEKSAEKKLLGQTLESVAKDPGPFHSTIQKEIEEHAPLLNKSPSSYRTGMSWQGN